MLEHKDDAFRRFLERATDDPDGAGLAPLPLRPPSQQRPYRIVLAAAACVVVLIGTVVLTRRSATERITTRPPAASPGNGSGLPTASARATVASTGVGTTAAPSALTSAAVTSAAGSASPPTTTGVPPSDPASDSASVAPTVTAGATEPLPVGATPTTASPDRSPVLTPLPTTAPAPSSPRLRLDLAVVPPGAGNGTPVQPTAGPALHVEQVGAGAITAAVGVPGGRSFVPGGQQRTDYAVLTRVGADVAALAPATGRVTISFTSLGGLDERVSPTGRNIHTWYELVSAEGAANLVTGVSLQIDPEIGPYFSVAIAGTHGEYTLSAADRADFAAGRPVTIALEWTTTTGRLLLNGRTSLDIALQPASITWDPTARVSVGGSATYGGGYFSIHDDALSSIEISDIQS